MNDDGLGTLLILAILGALLLAAVFGVGNGAGW